MHFYYLLLSVQVPITACTGIPSNLGGGSNKYISESDVCNSDLEENYALLKEYVLELAPRLPPLQECETVFLLLSVNLNIHGECIFHQRGGKGKCRDTCMSFYKCMCQTVVVKSIICHDI